MPTLTTLLRLADDSTAPITITRSGPCRQWSAVTIDGSPVKRCKRGHVLMPQTQTRRDRGYKRCSVCSRIASQKYRDKNKIELSRKRRERYHRGESAKWQRGATVTRKG